MGGEGVLGPRAMVACGAPGPTIEVQDARRPGRETWCNRPAGPDGDHRCTTHDAVLLASWPAEPPDTTGRGVR